jgi:DNA-binding NarL/FixJ family response regulator
MDRASNAPTAIPGAATMTRPSVLLAEDHPESAALLRDLIQAAYDVVGEVADGYALVAEAERLAPDVIVTDISMPGLDGIEAACRIRARNTTVRIVLVTAHSEPALVERGLSAGALGYVVKGVAGDELVPVIYAALRGERRVRGVAGLNDDGTPRPAEERRSRRRHHDQWTTKGG